MNCPQCGSGLAEDATVCPECGAPVAEARSRQTPEPLEGETHALLAEANLLRLRRQYESATTKCVEVLRRYPNDASAHSLLGDIARDQGAYTDALGWYRLALQLDPTSTSDSNKIAQVEHRLSSLSDDATRKTPSWRAVFARAFPRPPIGLLLGLALGCILVATLVALSREKGATRASILDEVLPRVVAPGARPPSRDVAPAPTRRAEDGRDRRSAPRDEAREPVIYAPGKDASSATPAADVAVSPSDKERVLLESLRSAAEAEGLMTTVDAVTVDPRDGAATLSIMVEDAVASPDTRYIVLQKCLRAAEVAFATDDELTRATLHCAAPVPGPGGMQNEETVFIGDISRSALTRAAGRSLTMGEALALFASPPWWHAQMRPPA
ncbi:MAG: tetratricopeptide repeat protein [Armatimonadota bacterium]|nr:MAG: tetratricopeptide repeat protein [Armatimonadota bacterium]